MLSTIGLIIALIGIVTFVVGGIGLFKNKFVNINNKNIILLGIVILIIGDVLIHLAK